MTEVTVFLDRADGVRLTVAGRAGRSLMRAAQAPASRASRPTAAAC
jgi:hypothetical protein